MERKRDETLETAVGTMAVLTAGGVLTFGLFPLVLPTVVLLAALALPLLPLGVVAALFAAAYLLLRSLVRLVRRVRPASRRGHRAAATEGRSDPVRRAPYGPSHLGAR